MFYPGKKGINQSVKILVKIKVKVLVKISLFSE